MSDDRDFEFDLAAPWEEHAPVTTRHPDDDDDDDFPFEDNPEFEPLGIPGPSRTVKIPLQCTPDEPVEPPSQPVPSIPQTPQTGRDQDPNQKLSRIARNPASGAARIPSNSTHVSSSERPRPPPRPETIHAQLGPQPQSRTTTLLPMSDALTATVPATVGTTPAPQAGPSVAPGFIPSIIINGQQYGQASVVSGDIFQQPNFDDQPTDETQNDPEPHPAGFLRLNAADLAERNGEPPIDEFIFPTRRVPGFDLRFFGEGNSNVIHIARKTETHIGVLTRQNRHSDVYVLPIWGRPHSAILAKRDLNALAHQIELDIEANELRQGGSWEKINVAPSDRMMGYMELQRRKAEERKKYTQPPPEGQTFNYVGIFVWPSKEVNPQSALGVKFEVLDPIRFSHRVYIIFHRRSGTFRCMGRSEKSVTAAIDRIYGVFCELATKSWKSNKMILVDAPGSGLLGMRVRLDRNHNLLDRQVTVKRAAVNAGAQVYLVGPSPDAIFLKRLAKERTAITENNLSYMRRAVEAALRNVVYRRGCLRLKIFIGRLVLFNYKRPPGDCQSVLEYIENSRNSMAYGELLRSIGTVDGRASDEETAMELMTYMVQRREIFRPLDIDEDRLHHDGVTRPGADISATFLLRMYNENGRIQDVRVEITFERIPQVQNIDYEGIISHEIKYKVGSRRWFDASTDPKGGHVDSIDRRKGPLDIKVQDLELGLAYQVELTHQDLFKNAENDPLLSQFVRHLEIERAVEEGEEPNPRITFRNVSGITVTSVVQKTKYRYWLKGSGYDLEITKYESLPVIDVSSRYPDNVQISWNDSLPPDVRWGCALFNEDWKSKLRENEGLSIGKRGKWEPNIDEFFSKTSSQGLDPSINIRDGFEECTVRLKDILGFIRAAQCSVIARKAWGNGVNEGSWDDLLI